MAESLPQVQASPTSYRSDDCFDDRHDSAIEVSPIASNSNSHSSAIPISTPVPKGPLSTTSNTTYESLPVQRHRIIPPRIAGHGQLLIPRRSIPTWVGVIVLVGVFSWAVWCAIYVYPLLGGHSNDWKSHPAPEGWKGK